jgi:lipopolysaccharide export system permease protein
LLIKRVDSYIFERLFTLFMLCLLLFSFILFFSDTLLDFLLEMQKFALPLNIALRQVLLYFPMAMALAIPASVFLAVLMGYNGLNQHFELIAFRIHGLSLWRLAVPALLLGLLAFALDFTLVNQVVPWANRKSQLLKIEALSQGVLPENQESFSLVTYDKDNALSKLVYVAKTHEKQLNDITLIDLNQKDVLQVVQATSGQIFSDRWEFYNANIYEMFKNNSTLGFSHIGMMSRQNMFNAPEKLEELRNTLESSKTLNFKGLWQRLRKQRHLGEAQNPKDYVRLWEKLTLPVSCFALALVAVPFAITPPRQGSERGFLFALLALFVFYVVRSLSVSLGQAGLFTLGGLLPFEASVAVACWLPVVVMLVLALLLLQQKSKVL